MCIRDTDFQRMKTWQAEAIRNMRECMANKAKTLFTQMDSQLSWSLCEADVYIPYYKAILKGRGADIQSKIANDKLVDQ